MPYDTMCAMALDWRTRRGLKPVPDDLRARVAAMVEELGPAKAAKALGVTTRVVLAVTSGIGVLPCTLTHLGQNVPNDPDTGDAA